MSGGWDYYDAVAGRQRTHGGLGAIEIHRPTLTLPRGVAFGTPPTLPHPDDYYFTAAERAGELGAEALAAAITARTGVRTTADDILARAVTHGILDPDVLGSTLDRARLTLSSIVVDARGQASDLMAPLRQLSLTLPGGLGQAMKLVWALDKAGLGEATYKAGLVLGRGFLTTVAPALLDIGRNILGGLNLTGATGEALFDWLGDTVGAAADKIAAAMPVMSAMFKTAIGVVNLVMDLLPATSGRTVHLDQWSREMNALYRRLSGYTGPTKLSFNPFYQEMFFIQGGTSFGPVRALEARYWGMPDWRATFISPTANEWAARGDLALTPEVAGVDRFHTYDAQFVIGCCSGHGTQRPWRWNLDDTEQKKRLSAAILAAAYLRAGSPGCVWGIGAWDNNWRAHLKNCESIGGEDMHRAYCYMDAREYDAGVRTVWPARGGDVGWLATWDVGRGGPVAYPYRGLKECDEYSDARRLVGWVDGQPAYAEPLSDRVYRDRSALDRLLVAARAGWMRLADIPAEAMPRLGPDPYKGISESLRKAPSGRRSPPPSGNGAGLGTVAVVGGVGLGLAALVWALTK